MKTRTAILPFSLPYLDLVAVTFYGLDNYQEMMRLLVDEKKALKVFLEVADE